MARRCNRWDSWGVTLLDHVSVYFVRRDHGRDRGWFHVEVSDDGTGIPQGQEQYGIGYQWAVGPFVFGVSVHNTTEYVDTYTSTKEGA